MLQRLFLQFVVTVDKIFLPKPVEEHLQNQEFHKVPLMTGVTNDEFGWLLPKVSKSYNVGSTDKPYTLTWFFTLKNIVHYVGYIDYRHSCMHIIKSMICSNK